MGEPLATAAGPHQEPRTQELWLIREPYPLWTNTDGPMHELADAEARASGSYWMLGPSYPLAWAGANEPVQRSALRPDVKRRLEDALVDRAESAAERSQEALRAFRAENRLREHSREREEREAAKEGPIRLIRQIVVLLIMAAMLLSAVISMLHLPPTRESLFKLVSREAAALVEGPADGATGPWVSPRGVELALAVDIARLGNAQLRCRRLVQAVRKARGGCSGSPHATHEHKQLHREPHAPRR